MPFNSFGTRRSPFAAIGQQAAGAQAGGRAPGDNRAPSTAGTNFDNAMQVYDWYYQPQYQQYRNQAASAQRDHGYRNQGYDIQAQDYRNQYANGQANIDLDFKQIGVDRDAANRQMGYYDDMFGVDLTRYNSDTAYLAGQQVFADGRYALAGRDLALDQQRYDLQGQTSNSVLAQIANQSAQAERTAMEDRRDTASDATFKGAFTAAGHTWDRGDIAAALGFKQSDLAEQTKQEKINREQQGVMFNRDKLDYEQAGIDYMEQTSANAHKRDGLAIDLYESGLSKNEQQARLGDRLRTLDIQAQRLGLDRQQLQNKLDTALRSLNLDRQMSTGQLIDMLNSADVGQRETANRVIAQALGSTTAMPGGGRPGRVMTGLSRGKPTGKPSAKPGKPRIKMRPRRGK